MAVFLTEIIIPEMIFFWYTGNRQKALHCVPEAQIQDQPGGWRGSSQHL